MMISIIAALARNGVIGKNNKLPWSLPADLRRFRNLTIDKTIIMGQKTFESLGKPLPNRTNIVLTCDKSFKPAGCLIAYSIKEALDLARNTNKGNEVMICGGALVYNQFLPLADRMYLTFIDADFDGDVFFPKFNLNEWIEVERIENQPDNENPYKYNFIVLERKKSEFRRC